MVHIISSPLSPLHNYILIVCRIHYHNIGLYLHHFTESVEPPCLYTSGRPADYFILILEGNFEVGHSRRSMCKRCNVMCVVLPVGCRPSGSEGGNGEFAVSKRSLHLLWHIGLDLTERRQQSGSCHYFTGQSQQRHCPAVTRHSSSSPYRRQCSWLSLCAGLYRLSRL